MNKMIVLTAAILVTGSAWAQAKKAPAVLTNVDELKWVDLAGAPGVQTATVEGDAAKGSHHFFLKFPAGFEVGAHHHSADHYATVLKGTVVLTADGKETKLPAGSYFAFTGKAKHATKCDAGSECVMFIDSRGAWDAVMADAKAKKM